MSGLNMLGNTVRGVEPYVTRQAVPMLVFCQYSLIQPQRGCLERNGWIKWGK